MKRCILFILVGVFIFSPVYAQTVSNVVVESGENYEVGQLSVGERVYIDRSYVFQSVPLELIGATYIKTANSDKKESPTTFLTFTVDQPVTVYISHDVRISPKPSWISAFVNTGWGLVTDDSIFDVYRKDFPTGTVILGGNTGTKSSSMYSVAVVQSELPVDPWPGPPAGQIEVDYILTHIESPQERHVTIAFEWDAYDISVGVDYFAFYITDNPMHFDIGQGKSLFLASAPVACPDVTSNCTTISPQILLLEGKTYYMVCTARKPKTDPQPGEVPFYESGISNIISYTVPFLE